MKSLYNLLFLLMLLVTIGIFMYFIIYTEKFDNNVRESKTINPDLLSHSVMLQNNQTEEYETLLNKDSLNNSIKYSEGMKWDKWIIVDSSDVLSVITDRVKQYIETFDIQRHIIFCKLNRYKLSLNEKDFILLDYDIVLYNKQQQHADHGKLICVFKDKKGIDIIHFKVFGKINEDYIYMKNNPNQNISYSSYNQLNLYKGDFLDSDDTNESMCSHDNQVKKLLYNKLMQNTIVNRDDVDFINNQKHKRAHKIVRNMFIKGLKKTSASDSEPNPGFADVSLYKAYPYKNDFTIM